METYKYWSSFDKNYNASVMKLKKSSIIVIPPGAQDPNLKKSAWFFQVLPPWQCPFKFAAHWFTGESITGGTKRIFYMQLIIFKSWAPPANFLIASLDPVAQTGI